MTDKSELKLADGSTDYSQIPSYSSTGPSRRESTRVAHQFRLRVISAPAGQLCKSNQGTCEWYEVVDGERKCGWYGDALHSHESGPIKCVECLESGAPRKRDITAAARSQIVPWTTHDQTLLKRAARQYSTDAAAAKALGIPRSSLSRYLTGERKPAENTALRGLRRRIELVLAGLRKST